MHNRIAGDIYRYVEHGRYTPYFLPHSTEVAGLSIIPGGDDRYINNLFCSPFFRVTKERISGNTVWRTIIKTVYPMMVDGNVYYNGALPSKEKRIK